ncbi:MAG: DMT family transporter [Alphaproteobacteria bacterium]|nr:DMT family transporter [Alphaproteobacteria bacterium]
MLLLSLVWASAFSMIKIAVPYVGPVVLVFARCLIGAMVMAVILVLMRGNSVWPRGWRQWSGLAGVGVVSTALPFTLISYAEQNITSSLTAVLMTVGPLVAIMLGHYFTDDEKINRGKLMGICLGFLAAVYLLRAGLNGGLHSGLDCGLDSGKSGADGGNLLHMLAVIAAAACYAIGGLGAKKLPHVSSEVIAAMVLLVSALVMIPALGPSIATLMGEGQEPGLADVPLKVWLALVWLGVMPSGLAFYLRYFLIKRNGYGFVSYVGYLIPLFAIVIGVVLLGEAVTVDTVLAMAVILGGLVLTRGATDLPWSISPKWTGFRRRLN